MNHNTNQILPLTDSIVHNELLNFWSVLPDDPEHAFNLKNGMLDPCCFELHVLRMSWRGFPCTETAEPSGGFLALLAALSPHIMCKFENLPPELKSVFFVFCLTCAIFLLKVWLPQTFGQGHIPDSRRWLVTGPRGKPSFVTSGSTGWPVDPFLFAACDEWAVLPRPDLYHDVNRFGHSAVFTDG